MKKLLAQFIDLDTVQRSEPFTVEYDKASEILNLLQDYLKAEVEGKRNIGVLVLMETVEVDKDGSIVSEMQVSKAPIMKFETFKQVMEQKAND